MAIFQFEIVFWQIGQKEDTKNVFLLQPECLFWNSDGLFKTLSDAKNDISVGKKITWAKERKVA